MNIPNTMQTKATMRRRSRGGSVAGAGAMVAVAAMIGP